MILKRTVMGTEPTMNESLFLLINANKDSPRLVLIFALLAADYLIFIVPLVLIAMWCWGKRREAAFRAVCVSLIALGLGQIISAIYFHPRPFMVSIGRTFAQHIADASFPSDHSLLMFSVSFAFLLCGEALLGVAMLAIGVLIAWCRVYLGIHFPFDIAGAAVVAAAACGLVWGAWKALGMEMMGRVEALYKLLFSFSIARGWMRD